MGSINRIVLTGGLTRDPELRETPGGTSVTTLRVAFTTLRKVDGKWRERSNYIDVELWGLQADNAATYLSKGRQIAVDGRLEWSEYETVSGARIQLHRVVADSVQYLAGNGRREAQPASADDVDPDDHRSEDSFGETSPRGGGHVGARAMVIQSRESAAVKSRPVTVARALRILELQSRRRVHERGWVETGAVADALGVTVGEAAASLRVAARLGLCSRRRSLRHGTIWRPPRGRASHTAESVER